jgi:tRNA U34 5-carboxymethylaminomethyl modifying GTPase MnmE/TrmE
MDKNQTLSYNCIHIGCRNAGKSSLVNVITGQNLVIVSPVKGILDNFGKKRTGIDNER